MTPDSFYDGGRYVDPATAVQRALAMVEEGAHIIDIGGESTRPFSDPVGSGTEMERVLPVIAALRRISDVIISIDTYRSDTAREAIAAGADMVNDISGFRFDETMAATVAESGVYGVIMHMQGSPKEMQVNPYYSDVVEEIDRYFRERLAWASSKGVDRGRIILDPGIGFGKRVEDNLKIIKNLGTFKGLGRPLLVGTSMKSFIGTVTDSPLEERTEGTLASLALSLWNGADVIRVHNVAGARKVAMFVDAVMRA